MQIIDNYRCTGCGACANVCAHEAIQMKENSEGFLEPAVDEAQCVSCGICESVCPVLNERCNVEDDCQKSFLVTTSDESYYRRSATIGLCTMLSEWIISKNGVVYGVWLDESEWKAKHVCVSSTKELEKIRNSKYIQSDSGHCFKEIKERLVLGEKVLFVGTPCQVAGLKSFLFRPYENLYTIDLVCHGVYSHKLLAEEVAYWEKSLKGKVEQFRFRSKEVFPWSHGGVINFDLVDKRGNKKHVERHGKFSPTYRCYAYSGDGLNYNLRKCCYSCAFRDEKRYGDLTVGDAWMISEKYLDWNQTNCNRGVSLTLTNTPKGVAMMDGVSSKVQIKEIPRAAAFVQPALLDSHRPIPAQRDELYARLGQEDYGQLVNRILEVDLESLYRKEVGSQRKKKIKKAIKKLVYGDRN